MTHLDPLIEVDVTVWDTRSGRRVGTPWYMPTFFVRAASEDEAKHAVTLILGVTTQKAKSFDIRLKAAA